MFVYQSVCGAFMSRSGNAASPRHTVNSVLTTTCGVRPRQVIAGVVRALLNGSYTLVVTAMSWFMCLVRRDEESKSVLAVM